MEEFVEEFEVPDFSRHKCVNGEPRIGTLKESSETEFFSLKIYPNGNKSMNEDYLSIVFELNSDCDVQYELVTRFYTGSLFNCTLSVVDSNGESRFAQSFGMDCKEKFLVDSSFEVGRFIRKRVLVDSREEFLPKDTLTLRCEVVCFNDLQKIRMKKADDLRRAHLRAIAQEVSCSSKESDDGYRLYDLKNADSSLCTKLREKSEFFECLFQLTGKGAIEEHVPIHKSEYDAFFNMLCYILNENLAHVGSELEYCELYEMANKYGLLELQELCSEYIKQTLTCDCAIEALRAADLADDAELRTVAFRHALSNWKDVREYIRFKRKISWQLPKSIKELICAAKILNLEDEISMTLYDLAARQVLSSRKRLKRSPTWAIFASEMPDLAKVISSLYSEEYKPAEKYKEHAMSYDFYR